jgi:PTH1 family peptidyl-tRNA hydrolase
MKIIVGLGNPGKKYERTRHNAGFMAVEEVARGLHADIAQEKYHALIGKARIDSIEAILVKPQTFMNNSGRSVGAIIRYTHAALSDIVVLHDDLDLPLGTVRIKAGGGHGGHNGLRSIIEHLGSPDFIRVRIGIGRPEPDRDSADYVLSPIPAAEREPFTMAVVRAAQAATAVTLEGPTGAMNTYNQK